MTKTVIIYLLGATLFAGALICDRWQRYPAHETSTLVGYPAHVTANPARWDGSLHGSGWDPVRDDQIAIGAGPDRLLFKSDGTIYAGDRIIAHDGLVVDLLRRHLIKECGHAEITQSTLDDYQRTIEALSRTVVAMKRTINTQGETIARFDKKPPSTIEGDAQRGTGDASGLLDLNTATGVHLVY